MSIDPRTRRRRYFFVWIEVHLLMAVGSALLKMRQVRLGLWCLRRACELTLLMLKTEEQESERKKI
jgi:hypothetical protein